MNPEPQFVGANDWWISLLANLIEIGAFLWAIFVFRSINKQVEIRLQEIKATETRLNVIVNQFAQRIRLRSRLPAYLTDLDQQLNRLSSLVLPADEETFRRIGMQCREICNSIRKSDDGSGILRSRPRLTDVLDRLQFNGIPIGDAAELRVQLSGLHHALTQYQQDIHNTPS